MATQHDTLAPMRSPLHLEIRSVFADGALRPIAAALFLHGLSQGMTVPLLALWIAAAYHGGAPATAAYFGCAALGGLLLNPWLGRLADSWGRPRFTAAIAAGLQAAGLVALALRLPFPLVLVVAACLMASQMQPHLFTLVDRHIRGGEARRGRALTLATLRSMISAAWIVGAPLGGLLAARGYTALFLLAAGMNLAAIACTLAFCRDRPGPAAAPGAAPAGPPAAPPRSPQLLLFALAVALITAGNAAKMQAVPIYLAHLGWSPALVGAAFGWMALAEMLLMPPVGRLADRVSRRQVIALGSLGGVVFFGAIGLLPGPLAVVLAFPAIAFLIAALYGVGIGYAQDLDPEHPGLAGGTFFAAQGVGSAAGGPLIAASTAAYGLPGGFLLPALAVLAGGCGVLLTRPARDATLAAPALVVGAGD